MTTKKPNSEQQSVTINTTVDNATEASTTSINPSDCSSTELPEEAIESSQTNDNKDNNKCSSTVNSDDVKQPVKTIQSKKKRIGRPKKEVVAKVKNPVGRPRGDNSVIAEYKQRMIASPKSRKVLDAVLDAASDPDHKNFTAAAKLVMDRLLPVSAFEEAKGGNKGNSISITITGVDGSKTVIGSGNEDVDEADFEEVEEDS